MEVSLKNWVVEILIPTNATFFKNLECPQQKILGIFAQLRVYFERLFLDVLSQGILGFSIPRSFPVQHFIEYKPDCPNVTLWCVGFAHQEFWGHVQRCAKYGKIFYFFMNVVLGETKVPNFKDPFFDENVFWLQVSWLLIGYLWTMPSFTRVSIPLLIYFRTNIA